MDHYPIDVLGNPWKTVILHYHYTHYYTIILLLLLYAIITILFVIHAHLEKKHTPEKMTPTSFVKRVSTNEILTFRNHWKTLPRKMGKPLGFVKATFITRTGDSHECLAKNISLILLRDNANTVEAFGYSRSHWSWCKLEYDMQTPRWNPLSLIHSGWVEG